jgi:hypothetical protein
VTGEIGKLSRARAPAFHAQKILGANPYGDQLGVAVRILHGFDRVFGGKSPHHEGELTVGRRLDGKAVYALHVLSGMSASRDFNNKLDVFHVVSFLLLFSIDLTKLI